MTRQRIWMNPATDSAELRALVQAANPDAEIMGRPPQRSPPVYKGELTSIGEQLLIPGCEARQTQPNKPEQFDLWSR